MRPDPVDRRQQPADLVLLKQPIDIALELLQAPPQHLQVFAGVPHLDAIDLPVVAAHGAGRRGDQGGGELVAHFVAPIVAKASHATHRHALKAGRCGVGPEERCCQLAPELVHMTGELRKPEIHQPVQLPHPVPKVLAQPIAEPHQLAQFLRRSIGQPAGWRPLLRGEPRDPHRIDRIGLSPLQVLAREAPRPQRVQQRHGEAGRDQRGEQILPVMAGRLHGDQGVGGCPEHSEQLGVPVGVFGERRCLEEDSVALIDHGNHVPLRRHIDAHKAHAQPFRRGRSGASLPVLMLTLVHARTPTAPQDTVRVVSTGRGRQSHNRGPSLKPNAATLSRIPSTLRYTRSAS